MDAVRRVVEVPGLLDSRQWGYAQVVVAGDLIFVSGQAGLDEQGNVVSLEFSEQARRTFQNIDTALGSVGASLADVVAMTAFITDWRYGRTLTKIRSELMGDSLPTDALVAVSQLAFPEMLVEIQSIAARPG
jgi:2-iminobutanoate/2-iminopropanoate deaminase